MVDASVYYLLNNENYNLLIRYAYFNKLLHVALELVSRSIGVLSLSVNNANWL